MPILNGQTVTVDYMTEHRQSQRCQIVTINGQSYARNRVAEAQCQCLSTYGQQHHVGCAQETCPVCDDPINECGCLNGD